MCPQSSFTWSEQHPVRLQALPCLHLCSVMSMQRGCCRGKAFVGCRCQQVQLLTMAVHLRADDQQPAGASGLQQNVRDVPHTHDAVFLYKLQPGCATCSFAVRSLSPGPRQLPAILYMMSNIAVGVKARSCNCVCPASSQVLCAHMAAVQYCIRALRAVPRLPLTPGAQHPVRTFPASCNVQHSF